MSKIDVVSRNGRVLETIDREVRRGTKGKLKHKLYVTYKNRRYIAYPVKEKYFVLYSIHPWGI